MRRSRSLLAGALLGLLIGLLTTILVVVPAGAAFVSGGKAPSDRPTYSYDSSPAATTPTTSPRTDTLRTRSGPRATSGLVRVVRDHRSAAKVERFLPDEYYEKKLNGKAPGQGVPYDRYEQFDENGNLKQVTTYDRYGDRAHQYDIGPGTRHGEGSHRFDYDEANPRQRPGGGRRSDHERFGG